MDYDRPKSISLEQLKEIDQFRVDAYPIVDQWCSSAVDQCGSACRRGCAGCCYNLVTTSLLEALAILRDPSGRAIFERERSRVVSLADLYLGDARGPTLNEWILRQERCFFLTDNNECAIYSVRPFNCRTHIAAEKPCDPEQEGNLYIDVKQAVRLGLELNHLGAGFTGIPFTVCPFPVSLILADAILREGVGAAVRMFPELVDPFLSVSRWVYIEQEDIRCEP